MYISPILNVQLYKSNFTCAILQVRFTSFARSTTEQMPALVMKYHYIILLQHDKILITYF
jgi:hypothetical protein